MIGSLCYNLYYTLVLAKHLVDSLQFMATELYKEEDSWVYNIEARKLLLNSLILSCIGRICSNSVKLKILWSGIHTRMDLMHWSHSETAGYHKMQPRKSRQAGWVVHYWKQVH